MAIKDFDFTPDEVSYLRCLVFSEMLKVSDHLNKIRDSDDKLLSHWNDNYQFLKTVFNKFSY